MEMYQKGNGMDILLIVTLFLIGFIGSFISGMVGIGGSIIKYPLLLYLPPLLNVGAFSAAEVAGISSIQVFFASIAGVWAFRKDGYLNKRLILIMGISVLIGSFVGGFGSEYLTNTTINLVYAIMATIAATMLFIPRKQEEELPSEDIRFNQTVAAVS